MSIKAGSNLNTVSMTPIRKNNTCDECNIKGVPSVSAKAGSNLITVSMTTTLELKNKKEVPLQQSRTKPVVSFAPQEKRDATTDKSLLPEKGNME